jgi:diguanylate cyclase (GGDEF)-like protein/PAS domain S-box-containing protein
MKVNVRAWLLLLGLLMVPGILFAQEPIKLGIVTYRPKPLAIAQWAPLEAALNKAIPEQKFVIEIYTIEEMVAAVAARQPDFVLANPSSYMLMAQRSGLSAPLATLSVIEQGQIVDAFGGVIFTRADHTDIKKLSDIAGKKVAVSAIDSFAGYQVQAYELLHAGAQPPQDSNLLVTGMPQDNVVEAVLTRKAEVGFVRSGLIESMVREKKLALTDIAVVNRQHMPGFPSALSTRLYPEWPLASMPHANRDLQRKLVSYLLLVHENKPLAQALGIGGFNVPSDYTPVENLLREMRQPPFDVAPAFTISDVVNRYKWPMTAGGIGLTLILLLAYFLTRINRRLAAEKIVVQLQANKLSDSRRQYQRLAEDMPLFLATFSPDGTLSYLNDAFSHFLAKPANQLMGKNFLEQICREDCAELKIKLQAVTLDDSLTSYLQHYRQANEEEIYHQWTIRGLFDNADQLVGFQAVGEDISDRMFAEQEIRNLAFYDPLTKLPNRRLLIDRLHSALVASTRSGQYGAVLFLDMDKFKTLNDTLGHDCGDLMLIEVAARIQSCVRGVDTVARLGGDEFVVLLEEVSDEPRDASQKVAQVAEKIRAALAGPYQLKGSEQHSSPSIGVSFFLAVISPLM